MKINVPSKILGPILVLMSAAGFSIMGLCGKVAYAHGLNLSSLLAWRFLIASIIFWPIVLLKRQYKAVPTKEVIHGFLLGAVGFWGVAFLYFTCIKYISTGMTSVLLYTYPSFVALGGKLFFKRKLSGRTMLALILCIIGTTLMAMNSGTTVSNLSTVGLFLGIGMAIYYSLYILSGEVVGKKISTTYLSTLIITGTSFSFFLQALSQNELILPVDAAGWVAILALAIFSTVIAIHFLMLGIQHIGSLKSALISTIEPVLTVFFGMFLLGEQMEFMQIIGALAIFTALLLSSFHRRSN